jgi:O-antigen biosynthesis protein
LIVRFSLLVPCLDTSDAALIGETVASIRRQSVPSWELVIGLTENARRALRPWTRRLIRSDARIHLAVVDQQSTHGMALAAGYALSAGEWVGIVSPGDTLAPTALADVEQGIASTPLADCWYTDENTVDRYGIHDRAFYKPDWSPERLRSHFYIGGLFVARRSIVDELRGLTTLADLIPGAEQYDLTLRVTEVARSVGHVPVAVFHRYQSDDALAPNMSRQAAARLAVSDQLRRLSIDAVVVTDEASDIQRVRRSLIGTPLISIVIPTRGSAGHVWGTDRIFVIDAVRSLIERCSYRNFELLIVHDDVTPAPVLDELRFIAGERVRFVPYDKPFNFSEKINLGRAHAKGELLLLLNDDIEVIAPDFLETMAALAQEADVGSVGAKLLLADGRLQHGGHVYCGEPHHILWGRWRDDPGPFDILAVQREGIGMTAACLMTRCDVFDEVGGFPVDFPIDFNDVEFALKLHQRGYRSIWTPAAELYHFETQTREKVSKPEDVDRMYDRWDDELRHDPYFNPNLAPHRDDWVELGLR